MTETILRPSTRALEPNERLTHPCDSGDEGVNGINEKSKRPRAARNRIPPVQMAGRPSAREIVAQVMAARKAFRLAAGGVKGRFKTQEELLEFIACEIFSGRKHSDVARDAWISDLSLRRLIDAEKVLLPTVSQPD